MDIKVVEPRYITCKNCVYSVPATFPEAQIKCSCKYSKVIFDGKFWICYTYRKRDTNKNKLIGELSELKCKISLCKDIEKRETLQRYIDFARRDIDKAKIIEESLRQGYSLYLQHKKFVNHMIVYES